MILKKTRPGNEVWLKDKLINHCWIQHLVVDVVSICFSPSYFLFHPPPLAFHGRCQGSQCRKIDHLVVVAECVAWAANELKRSFYDFGCFNRMIPDLYLGNGCFIQHPFKHIQNLQLVVSLVWNICNRNMYFRNFEKLFVQFILCGCVLFFFQGDLFIFCFFFWGVRQFLVPEVAPIKFQTFLQQTGGSHLAAKRQNSFHKTMRSLYLKAPKKPCFGWNFGLALNGWPPFLSNKWSFGF